MHKTIACLPPTIPRAPEQQWPSWPIPLFYCSAYCHMVRNILWPLWIWISSPASVLPPVSLLSKQYEKLKVLSISTAKQQLKHKNLNLKYSTILARKKTNSIPSGSRRMSIEQFASWWLNCSRRLRKESCKWIKTIVRWGHCWWAAALLCFLCDPWLGGGMLQAIQDQRPRVTKVLEWSSI